MDNLHPVQMQIIRELTFSPSIKFSELNVKDLESDKFSYHIRKLLNDGLIKKDKSDKYSLTNKGKLYSSHMDTNTNTIEKQPKSSVLVIVHKKNKQKNSLLIHTRTKEPYYNYSGFLSGKIRYGETLEEAALRELEEETGLLGSGYKHHFVLHEMVYNFDGDQLEDKFFHIVGFSDTNGSLLDKSIDGKNRWITEKQLRETELLFHNEIEILDWFLKDTNGFIEKKYQIKEF